MLKHGFYLALAIAVGLAVAKMFGGSFNLTSLFGGSTSTTTPCRLAALAFGESFDDGPRVNRVRAWLRRFEAQGKGQAALVNIYREYGVRLAAWVEASRVRSFCNRLLFGAILRVA